MVIPQEKETSETISTEEPGPDDNNVDSERSEHCSLWEKRIANYPHLEGDAKFLDEFEVFFNRYRDNTSTLFGPFLGKL